MVSADTPGTLQYRTLAMRILWGWSSVHERKTEPIDAVLALLPATDIFDTIWCVCVGGKGWSLDVKSTRQRLCSRTSLVTTLPFFSKVWIQHIT